MDDYGNIYQTDEWACGEASYAHSMATFGLLDPDWLPCQYWNQEV